jgi:hypothetical protein
MALRRLQGSKLSVVGGGACLLPLFFIFSWHQPIIFFAHHPTDCTGTTTSSATTSTISNHQEFRKNHEMNER